MATFEVEFRVRGSIGRTIEAESLEDARKAAEAMILTADGADWSEMMCELDEVDDVDLSSLRQYHKIKRNGEIVMTTYVRTTDEVIE